MTIIEAYSKSVPVISRDLGAMSDMIIHGKTGFHYGTKKQLNAILNQIDSKNYIEMGNNAFSEFVKRYDESSGLKNLVNLVNESTS